MEMYLVFRCPNCGCLLFYDVEQPKNETSIAWNRYISCPMRACRQDIVFQVRVDSARPKPKLTVVTGGALATDELPIADETR